MITLGKDAFYTVQDLGFDAALDHLQAGLTAVTLTEDAAEGVAAFMEKRPPGLQGSLNNPRALITCAEMKFLRTLGWTMIWAGGLIMAFLVYQLWGTGLITAHAQAEAEAMLDDGLRRSRGGTRGRGPADSACGCRSRRRTSADPLPGARSPRRGPPSVGFRSNRRA